MAVKKRKTTKIKAAVKRGKPAAKRKVAKKTAIKKRKSTRASTAKKKTIKKKTVTRKKVVKKKVVKKKTARKKVIKKKAVKKKVVSRKKTATKSPAKKAVKKATRSKVKKLVKKKTVAKAVKSKNVRKKSKPVSAKPKAKARIVKQSERKAVKRPTTTRSAGKRSSEGAFGIRPYNIKEGDTYMDQAQLQHFRHILLAWKQQLMKGAGNTVVHLQEDMLAFPDPVDRASQEENYSLELRTRDRERKLLRKIEQTLDIIESGDYGFCEDCGSEIGIRRLEARPTATKCIDCKTYEEIRERQGAL